MYLQHKPHYVCKVYVHTITILNKININSFGKVHNTHTYTFVIEIYNNTHPSIPYRINRSWVWVLRILYIYMYAITDVQIPKKIVSNEYPEHYGTEGALVCGFCITNYRG